MTLMVRSGAAPEAQAPAIRTVVAGLDPKIPVGRIRSLSEVVETSLGSRRSLLVLTGSFATLTRSWGRAVIGLLADLRQ